MIIVALISFILGFIIRGKVDYWQSRIELKQKELMADGNYYVEYKSCCGMREAK
jgi:hypothetical protein